jgi:hypothetical protein
MLYRYWRQIHSEWPVKLGTIEGKPVRLVQDIETRGGKRYKKGTVMTVGSTYRGKLVLEPLGGGPTCIRHVGLRDVELVKERL